MAQMDQQKARKEFQKAHKQYLNKAKRLKKTERDCIDKRKALSEQKKGLEKDGGKSKNAKAIAKIVKQRADLLTKKNEAIASYKELRSKFLADTAELRKIGGIKLRKGGGRKKKATEQQTAPGPSVSDSATRQESVSSGGGKRRTNRVIVNPRNTQQGKRQQAKAEAQRKAEEDAKKEAQRQQANEQQRTRQKRVRRIGKQHNLAIPMPGGE